MISNYNTACIFPRVTYASSDCYFSIYDTLFIKIDSS